MPLERLHLLALPIYLEVLSYRPFGDHTCTWVQDILKSLNRGMSHVYFRFYEVGVYLRVALVSRL